MSDCHSPSEKHLPLDPDRAWSMISETQEFLPIPTTNNHEPHDQSKSTRIACMSDTHGKHRKVFLPSSCNVLIHGGDFTTAGQQSTVQDLGAFFTEAVRQGITKEVICIAGNHDISFDHECCHEYWNSFHPTSTPKEMEDAMQSKNHLRNHCTYLENASTTIDNTRYYGSPCTPTFYECWAFMKDRDIIHSQWDLIPNETDVLITHGPPLGRGDYATSGVRAGCLNLLTQIQHRIQPRLHIFGHIHEGSGCTYDGRTLYVNASCCTVNYRPENACIVVDLPHDASLPAMVVVPNCTLDGIEILDWIKANGYDNIYPYFKNRKPLLKGEDLVCDDLKLDDLASKLKMHTRSFLTLREQKRKWRDLKEELNKAMMHLRCESYA